MNQFDKTNISDPFVSKNTIAPYSPGELNGLSFAIKDNIDVANEITGMGAQAGLTLTLNRLLTLFASSSC